MRCNSSRAAAGNAPDWKPGELATHCSQGHPFNEENTRWKGPRIRHCRICAREQHTKWQRERRRIKREEANLRSGWSAVEGIGEAP